MAIEFPEPLALYVSLARNDVELAKAAVEAGADGLKTHINVEHRASGTVFGSVADEREALEGILGLGVPVGLVSGGEGRVTRDELRAARELGFAFFDVYFHHAPAWFVAACPEGGAVGGFQDTDPLERASNLRSLGLDAIEASLTPHAEYGTPLHLARVADIARLREISGLPVIVPTQHAITPADVPALVGAGASALLIGAVVTGTTAEGVRQATTGFRQAIDGLSERQ
jgi:hypothetical protein